LLQTTAANNALNSSSIVMSTGITYGSGVSQLFPNAAEFAIVIFDDVPLVLFSKVANKNARLRELRFHLKNVRRKANIIAGSSRLLFFGTHLFSLLWGLVAVANGRSPQ
jgi:hypothetical protein